MATIDQLTTFIVEHIDKWLAKSPLEIRPQIYAMSLYTDVQGTELLCSINTEKQVEDVLQGEGGVVSIPSLGLSGLPQSEAEARWNYAFWPGYPNIRFFMPEDSPDAVLWRTLLAEHGLPTNDEELDDLDDDDLDGYEDKVLDLMAKVAVKVASGLHSNDVLSKYFEKPVPVIVHTLEYNEQTADQTRRANPPGLVDEFCSYVMSE